MGDSSSSEILKIIAAHSVARIRGLENLFVLLTWGLRPRLYAATCFAGLALLLVSQRNEWIDFRRSAGGDVAGDQCNERQESCKGAIRQDVGWSNTEQ